MIREGQMNTGRYAHNGSYVVILDLSLCSEADKKEVGLKLQWGDFDEKLERDMRIKVKPEVVNTLRDLGWDVCDVLEETRMHKNVAQVPPGVEVYILPERESYWDGNSGAIQPETFDRSKMSYPPDTLLFQAAYVRGVAMGIWKDGVYTPYSYDDQRKNKLAWLRLQAEKT